MTQEALSAYELAVELHELAQEGLSAAHAAEAAARKVRDAARKAAVLMVGCPVPECDVPVGVNCRQRLVPLVEGYHQQRADLSGVNGVVVQQRFVSEYLK